MDSNISSRRARTFAKVAAISIALLGLYIVGSMLISIYRTSYDSIWQMLFTFVFAGIMFAVGAYCLFTAYRIWLDISVRIIRRVSLIGAVGFWLVLLSLGLRIFQPSFLEMPWVLFMSPVGLIVGGGFYCLCKKLLISWLGLPREPNSPGREKTIRTFFSWLALFLFAALSSVLMHLAQQGQGDTDAPNFHLSFWAWAVLAPALAAYLLYKLGVYIALRNSRATTG